MIVAPSHCEEVISSEVAQVREQFLLSPYRSLRTLSCEAVRGMLVLRGTVATYFLKQLAQSIAQKVAMHLPVSNQISVSS